MCLMALKNKTKLKNLDRSSLNLPGDTRLFISDGLCPYYMGIWGKVKGLLNGLRRAPSPWWWLRVIPVIPVTLSVMVKGPPKTYGTDIKPCLHHRSLLFFHRFFHR